MFAHASRAVLSFLLLATAVTASPVAMASLEERQGSCLSGLASPARSNNIGRVSIQRNIDQRTDGALLMNNFVTVHVIPAEDIATTRRMTVEVSNSGSSSNTVLLNNYVNTLFESQPCEHIRIDIGPRNVSGGTITNSHVTGCVQLPRPDGTWYVQLER
ncbi:hypothetical protein IFR05_004601 [Cadophora sp. M221]|nr:hypothetical protein IFR05_004601 [Cadophora sp. M221]